MLTNLFFGKNTNCNKNIEIYDNDGTLVLTISGKEILIGNYLSRHAKHSNNVEIYSPSDLFFLLIDGHRIDSCGDTILISCLNPEINCYDVIFSSSMDVLMKEIKENKENYKKAYWVIIKSQTGKSICAYNCNEVAAEVMDDYPKITKILIDGQWLYVHRANFNIIDAKLIK